MVTTVVAVPPVVRPSALAIFPLSRPSKDPTNSMKTRSMKRYIPFLCFVFALTSLPTLSAGNRGCVIKKLATRPLPQRIGSRLGYQPTSVGIRLSGEIAELTEQLEEMKLAMQEKDLLQEKHAKEIQQLKQSLATEQKANKELAKLKAAALKAAASEVKSKEAALAAKDKAAAAAKTAAEKSKNEMLKQIVAIRKDLATSKQATQNTQKQLIDSQQQLNTSQNQLKVREAELADLKKAEQQRQKEEEEKRSQQKAVESTAVKEDAQVADEKPDAPAEKDDAEATDQPANKDPETDANDSAK